MAISILVVDDERTVASMLRMVLETHGYEVTVALSTAEALATMHAQRFDVVLTDMRMESQTSGYDVARAAAKLPSAPRIIILTGFPMPARDWKQSGAHLMLQKPAPIPRLLEAVEQVLAQRAPSKTSDPQK